MAALLARRLIQAVAVLLGVAVITFLLLHYLPADPAALVAGRSANAQMIASVRHQLGLDLPVPLQFWRYLTGLVRGDLGRSYVQRSEVATLVMARIPATLVLMACGILVEVTLGLTFGVIAALRRNGFVDHPPPGTVERRSRKGGAACRSSESARVCSSRTSSDRGLCRPVRVRRTSDRRD
jgi:peptide/nickel transport system permease protein